MGRPKRPQLPSDPPTYKGGRTFLTSRGYVMEESTDHPSCDKRGFVMQHRLVIEDQVGRYLSGTEVVHHMDKCRTNNKPENLLLLSGNKKHIHLHMSEDPNYKKIPISEQSVREALQGRSTQEAAHILGVHHMTLRNRFDHLLIKRTSPCNLDDPNIHDLVRKAALDNSVSLHDFAKKYRISALTAVKICNKLKIRWLKKSRKGEVHKTYRRKISTH